MKNVANCTLSPDVKSLKVAIQTLETRLQTFRSRQDWWNEGYLRLGLATLVLAVLLGGLSLFCQRKASNIELSSRPFAEELGRKNALLGEATDQAAQLEVSKAQMAASAASARSAKAEQHSAEANAKAEGFRLEIAKANESAQRAEARAAEANLELARFKAPRNLSPEQQAEIAKRLSVFGPYTVDIIIIGDSPEIANITNLIGSTLQQAGWKPKFMGKALSGPNVSGIIVGTHIGSDTAVVNAANTFIRALISFGIQTSRAEPQFDDTLPMAIRGDWDTQNVAPIRMYVSSKT